MLGWFRVLAMSSGALCLLGLALGGCTFAQDVARFLEPVLDTAVQTAANSAGAAAQEAIEKRVGAQWSGGEVAGTTAAAIMSAYAALKGLIYAWNRDPKGRPEA